MINEWRWILCRLGSDWTTTRDNLGFLRTLIYVTTLFADTLKYIQLHCGGVLGCDNCHGIHYFIYFMVQLHWYPRMPIKSVVRMMQVSMLLIKIFSWHATKRMCINFCKKSAINTKLTNTGQQHLWGVRSGCCCCWVVKLLVIPARSRRTAFYGHFILYLPLFIWLQWHFFSNLIANAIKTTVYSLSLISTSVTGIVNAIASSSVCCRQSSLSIGRWSRLRSIGC